MTNTQVLLKDLIQLEYEDDCNGFATIEDFFEFFSAKTVLKSYTLSNEEILQGIKGSGNDGAVTPYLFFVTVYSSKKIF